MLLTVTYFAISTLTHDVHIHVHYPHSACRYVARRNPRDSNSHHIVGIQTVKPLELAQQTSLDVGNAWGVLRAIIDICFQQPYDPTKKLLILKDPNQVFMCGSQFGVNGFPLHPHCHDMPFLDDSKVT